MKDYLLWKSETNIKDYKIKYYKGLATSTTKEAKEYFNDYQTHVKTLNYTKECDDILEKIFSKDDTDYRKDWL